MYDTFLILAQVALYYGVMIALFGARERLGIGTFFCALCALTFAETYLAMKVLVEVNNVTYSPGSALFFAGKLPLLLLAYIREDAETVRQPIYGLLVGNLLIVGLLLLISQQTPASAGGIDLAVSNIAQSASLSVWGTFLLFVDCIAMILLYEKISRDWSMPLFMRLWLTVAIILAIDHVAFFAALHLFFGVPISAGYGGLVAKLVAAGLFCGVLWAYLRFVEVARESDRHFPSLTDVFDVLTYRQRFEALDMAYRTDVLTGARTRHAFAEEAPARVRLALEDASALGVLLVDADHFKQVNDRHGHLAGDKALSFLVEVVTRTVGGDSPVYRLGGDEFAVLLGKERPATEVAEDLRRAASTARMREAPGSISISVGWASLREDGFSLDDLMAAADRRLYEEKARRAVVVEPADT